MLSILILSTLVGISSSANPSDSQQESSEFNLRASASFYPISPQFHQPLGHSKPYIFDRKDQRANYNHRLYDQPKYSPNSYHEDLYQQGSESSGILGSGNFGVIPGGTFYSDNDARSSIYEGEINSYLHNGHGRPFFSYERRPYPQEQFANFKDFADINAPADRQYSQYVVVYRNKDGTEKSSSGPKNIFESLQLIDDQERKSKRPKKYSKVVSKKQYEKFKYPKDDKVKDVKDPLIALS